MKLSALGEFGLINLIAKCACSKSPKSVLGIGDDCAVIPISKEKSFLISTDMLVERVHFRSDLISAKDLGYRSLSVNLSDLAAMGASPLYVFLSLALAPDINQAWCKNFLDGFADLAAEQKIVLLGGNTSRALKDTIINLTVIGEAHPDKIKTRSLAKVGDYIYVASNLGDAACGLDALLKKRKANFLIKKHRKPKAMITEGLWLANQSAVHAMIDLSDGLSSDLLHLCKASKVGAKIELTALPISKQANLYCKKYNLNPEILALAGGEDYSLLFSVEAKQATKLEKRYAEKFGSRIYRIGEFVTGDKKVSYFRSGKSVVIKAKGFRHF